MHISSLYIFIDRFLESISERHDLFKWIWSFDWSSVCLCSWLSIFHFPILRPPPPPFFFSVHFWGSDLPRSVLWTPPWSPFIPECFNWLDATDYIHLAPLSPGWLCESEGDDPPWAADERWFGLWPSSIMHLGRGGVWYCNDVRPVAAWLPSFLWGPDMYSHHCRTILEFIVNSGLML